MVDQPTVPPTPTVPGSGVTPQVPGQPSEPSIPTIPPIESDISDSASKKSNVRVYGFDPLKPNEEEKRELDKTKNEIDRAQIVANAEKARIAEVTGFEISEEVKKAKKLEELNAARARFGLSKLDKLPEQILTISRQKISLRLSTASLSITPLNFR